MSAQRASSTPETARLLDVRDLAVPFGTRDGVVEAVGGSRSPSTAAGRSASSASPDPARASRTQTMVGLTRGARITGSALFEGARPARMSRRAAARRVRGREIAMIFQNPLSSLHPLYRVGWQIVGDDPGPRAGHAAQARARAIELLGLVGIPHPDRRVDDYPHQFSGGMLQRAMIAMALALNPRCSSPTSPPPRSTSRCRRRSSGCCGACRREFGTAIILITHDLGVVAEVADDVIVMYAGRAMERADRARCSARRTTRTREDCSQSIPRADSRGERLTPIPGQPPSLIAPARRVPVPPALRARRCRSLRHDTPPLGALPGAVPPSACWLTASEP